MSIQGRVAQMNDGAKLVLIEELGNTLKDEAAQLDRWIVEVQDGGWSRNLVDPMRARASQIREKLVRLGF